MKQPHAAGEADENLTFEEGALDDRSRAPEPLEEEEVQISGWKRLGYALLGTAIAAMGFWIFPYQLERGELFKALTGAALAVLGSIVLYRALNRSRLRSLEKLIDFLSDLAS